MFLTQEEAAQRILNCSHINAIEMGFGENPPVVLVEHYMAAGMILFVKATNLEDSNDFVYLEEPHELESWMGVRFPKDKTVH